MITHTYRALFRHMVTVTVQLPAVNENQTPNMDNFANGEWTPNFSAPASAVVAVLPISRRELKELPEGEYGSQDVKVYELTPNTVCPKATMVYNGAKFTIQESGDRTNEGGFNVYLAKRNPVQ